MDISKYFVCNDDSFTAYLDNNNDDDDDDDNNDDDDDDNNDDDDDTIDQGRQQYPAHL